MARPPSGRSRPFRRTQPAGLAAGRMAWPAVQFAKGLEYLIDGNRDSETRRCPQRWTGCNRGCIGCPGSKNGPLFCKRKAGVAHHVTRMIEHRAGVEKGIEVK